MAAWEKLIDSRREYGNLALNEALISQNPFLQFEKWFADVLALETPDPTAMVLSTVDDLGLPDSRVVLLKGIEKEKFIFYTNYNSKKGLQLKNTPFAALNFYWPQMARQVRIRGRVTKISRQQSDQYFSKRPRESQLSAIISPQSRPIANRDELEKMYLEFMVKQEQKLLKRPADWGGYSISPSEIEFWQGRDNRLHDRIVYCKQGRTWNYQRLAP